VSRRETRLELLARLTPDEAKELWSRGWRKRLPPEGDHYKSPEGKMYRSATNAIKAVFERDNGVCAKCGWGSNPQQINRWCVDHVIPIWLVDRSHPDSLWFWTIENLQTLCVSCHKKKTVQELRLRKSGNFDLVVRNAS
jgi:5-methylcytosine-specific restriction endonuclease McrA